MLTFVVKLNAIYISKDKMGGSIMAQINAKR